MDKSLEEGHSMIKIIEVILGKVILEEHKIIVVRILEVNIEASLDMTILVEVEEGLEKDSTQVTLEEMREAVVDVDQVQEWVLIEIKSDALSGGSMITLLKTAWMYQIQKKEQSEQIQQMLILEEDETALKVLVADTYEDLIRANSEETICHSVHLELPFLSLKGGQIGAFTLAFCSEWLPTLR